MPMSNCFRCIYDLYTLHYFAKYVYKLNICIYKLYLHISALDQKSLKNMLILSRNLGWSQQRFDLDYRIGMDRHLDGGLAAAFCVHTLFWVWIKHVWDSPKKLRKPPCNLWILWSMSLWDFSSEFWGITQRCRFKRPTTRKRPLRHTRCQTMWRFFAMPGRKLFSCSHSCPLPFYRRI